MKKIFFQLIAFLYYLSDLIEKREREKNDWRDLGKEEGKGKI